MVTFAEVVQLQQSLVLTQSDVCPKKQKTLSNKKTPLHIQEAAAHVGAIKSHFYYLCPCL